MSDFTRHDLLAYVIPDGGLVSDLATFALALLDANRLLCGQFDLRDKEIAKLTDERDEVLGDYVGACKEVNKLLATNAALMDERDGALKDAQIATAYDSIRDGGKAWLVSSGQVAKWEADSTARAADVAALRGCVGWMRLYSAPIVGGMITDARARIAAWDKDQCDG